MPRVLGGRYFSCARSADGPDLVVADERGEVSSRVLYMALTVLYKAMTVLYIVMTVLYMAMTVLYMALTVLYVAGPTCPAFVTGTGAAEGGWREWGRLRDGSVLGAMRWRVRRTSDGRKRFTKRASVHEIYYTRR